MNVRNKIRTLVAEDKLSHALEMLTGYYSNSEKLDEILIQAARYNSLNRNSRAGIMNRTAVAQELNALRYNILSFVSETELYLK